MKKVSRRNFLNRSAGLGVTGIALGSITLPGWAETKPATRMRSLEGSHRVWDIWRTPGRFTKNPDLIRSPSGKMMLVFNDADQHWPQEISRITTLESNDNGKTWGDPRVVAKADVRKGEERWVTPRLSRLKSGRLVIVCDHDDYLHMHEDQPPGIWIWFSEDEGRTWSEPRLTGVPGIEPDRVIELDDGTLLMGSQLVFRDNYKLAQFIMRSTDGGWTWKDLVVIAKDQVHNHCEGAIVKLSNGSLACVMRENNHNGYPSHVSFSYDWGKSWTHPRPLPFAGDRPYAKELSDGRVLVTYRNQAGNRGTHAWVGDLSRDYGYQIGGVHYGDHVTLEPEALHIHDRPNAETRYLLMPPENFRSGILFEAGVRVDGPADRVLATLNVSRLGLRVDLLRHEIWCDFKRGAMMNAAHPDRPRIDARHSVDMTKYHTIRLEARKGRMWVAVDGKRVIHGLMIREWPLEQTWFGRLVGSGGDAWFRHVSYHAQNESEPEFVWNWQAALGRYPDQYQIDHMLEVRENPPIPGKRPDNGYSSWVELPDGSIYMVDYTNKGDRPPVGHLYAAHFTLEDFERR